MREFKVFRIFLLVCLVALSGCDKDNEKSPTSPKDSGLSAETYFPLNIGATWTYTNTVTELGEALTDTTTTTIVGTIRNNNKTYFVTVDSDEDSSYFRIENNIVYEFIPGEFQEIPILNFTKEVGETWEIFSETASGEGWSGSMTASGKYLGTENITVPAGTFSNCAKFEMNVIASGITEGVSESIELTNTTWLAPGVGPVKSTDEAKENNEVIGTSKEELIHYSIPQ